MLKYEDYTMKNQVLKLDWMILRIGQTGNHHWSLQGEVLIHGKFWIEFLPWYFMIIGSENFRPEVTRRVWHRYNFSRIPKGSVHGNCMSLYSKNRKDDKYLARSIIENMSVFWWNGNQEGDIIGVYSPHWDTCWCGCRHYWGPDQCLL